MELLADPAGNTESQPCVADGDGLPNLLQYPALYITTITTLSPTSMPIPNRSAMTSGGAA